MGNLLAILLLFVLSACSTIFEEAYYVGDKTMDTARTQVASVNKSTTIGDTYTVLKDGLKKDTYPTRKGIAGFMFPEMHDDYENAEINYHYDDRRILKSSIYPTEKPDAYVIEEERRYSRVLEAKAAAQERQERIRKAAEARKNLVYCYKSLADVTCYKEPQKGQEFRLVR